MASTEVEKDGRSSRQRVWTHALGMLLVAPLSVGLVHGLVSGFSPPLSFEYAVLKWFWWFGQILLGLVLAWFTLLARNPKLSWAVLAGVFIIVNYDSYYTERKLDQNPSERTLEIVSNSATAYAAVDPVQVTEVLERVEGISASMIDMAMIERMGALQRDRLIEKYKIRAKEAGNRDAEFPVHAQSIRYKQGDLEAVIVELTHPESKGSNVDLKVVWWIQDSQIKVVTCWDPSGRSIDYRRGACGRQVGETFGYSDWYRE